ncbi:MAG: tRNA (adenosine(37)-N6)-threonylcarbamoyltransferase complex ATPase subunit type 1 TsaE [Gammaproteobacteria bacterium]|nr:tRNA (adenosine(37)-N6)-threonylcarbamoyltransferase complex ATPase subunit type 1 TsaE [Gammaproteobacteria bacterium]
MRALGGRLARACAGGELIFLQGELGVGKTTLVRGFLRARGHGGTVKSPTYALLEPYALPSGAVYHLDLYRLSDPEELEYLGLRELLAGDAVCLVEWPERGGDRLPAPDLRVVMAYAGESRRVALQAGSARGRAVLERL